MACHFENERNLLKKYSFIAGVDEAGRGALAGPVVVAMVILNPKLFSKEIYDSKQLSPKVRNRLALEIKGNALAYSIGIIPPTIIDTINILQATYLGVEKCYKSIPIKPEHLLLDALNVKTIPLEQTSIIKGDTICFSIAAASILAKTTRDNIMRNLDVLHPAYKFAEHKGYGVKKHLLALKKFGICTEHRKSFAPVANLIEKNLFNYFNK